MTATLNLLGYDQTELVPIGRDYSVTLGKMLDAGKAVDDSHTVLPYIRAANIQDNGLRLTDVNEMPFSEDEAARLDLRSGDLLVVEGGAVGTSVVLDRDMPGWSFQKTVNRVRATGDWSTRYLSYVLRAYRDAGIIDLVCNGSTIPHLTAEKLRALRIPSASPSKQRAIVNYLDHETARIDTLIEEQRRLIDLLRERRRSVASDLLADRVGVGTRLKWSFDELDARAGAEADTLPLMSVSISWGVRRRDEVTQDESRAEDLSNYKICWQGDLVINRMRAFQGALGLAQEDGMVSPDYAVLRAKPNVSGEWLAAVMKSDAFVGEMSQRVKGIGSTDLGSARTPRINIADLGEIRIDLPTAEQQGLEVKQLRTETVKIDTLIAESERFVELARERRAALITSTVTGQVDVREEV